MKTNKLIVTVQKDPKTGECYLPLSSFEPILDISKVHSYTFERTNIDRLLDEPIFVLKFFDAHGNIVETFPLK